MTTNWIECQYDDDGEIINPEFTQAPDDSFWWIDSRNRCHTILMKSGIWFSPGRIARVAHPDD
jgi:hypothetical protein